VVIAASSNVNHYSVEEVTQFQIEAVEFFKTQFDLLSDEGFERAKQAYVRLLARPKATFKELFDFNEEQLIRSETTLNFDTWKTVSETLSDVSRDVFVKFFEENVRNNHDRKFLNAMEGGKQKLKQFQTSSSFKNLDLKLSDFTQVHAETKKGAIYF